MTAAAIAVHYTWETFASTTSGIGTVTAAWLATTWAAASMDLADEGRLVWRVRAAALGTVASARVLAWLGAPVGAHYLLVAANVLGGASVLMLARSARRMELGSALLAAHRSLLLACIALANGMAMIVSSEILEMRPPLNKGAAIVASTLGDGVVFCASAYALLRLRHLLRGKLAMPYLALSLAGVMYLMSNVAHLAHAKSVFRILATLGWSFSVSAAVSQALLARGWWLHGRH